MAVRIDGTGKAFSVREVTFPVSLLCNPQCCNPRGLRRHALSQVRALWVRLSTGVSLIDLILLKAKSGELLYTRKVPESACPFNNMFN